MTLPPVDPTGAAWNDYINNQSFNVTSLTGSPTTLSFPQVDSLAYLRTSTGIVAGFAIGFCAQLFIVLLLLTPKERRRQPIYLLNMTSLFLLTLNNICRSVIYCSTYQNSGPQLLGAFFAYGKTTWVPIVLQAIINPFLFASIMISLVLQTRVVFAAEPLTRHTITILGALAVLGEFGIATTNSVYSVILQYSYPSIVVVPQWIYRTQRLYFVVFVAICCAVFLWKLAMTILRRRRMGIDVKQFGPFQIVFIMFTQCLIVPRKIPQSPSLGCSFEDPLRSSSWLPPDPFTISPFGGSFLSLFPYLPPVPRWTIFFYSFVSHRLTFSGNLHPRLYPQLPLNLRHNCPSHPRLFPPALRPLGLRRPTAQRPAIPQVLTRKYDLKSYFRDRISTSTVSESVRQGRFNRFRGQWGSSSTSRPETKDSSSDIERVPSYNTQEVEERAEGSVKRHGGVEQVA
jgi:Fungal pheromone mating factor STE2 GPCR